MDELHRRFRRLDRLETPNLWNEAVGRAVELDLAPRRAFSPAMGLVATALLLAALAGTLAVGALLEQDKPELVNVQYENGVLTLSYTCGGVLGLDPTTFQAQALSPAPADCSERFGSERAAWSSDGRLMAYLARDGEEAGEAWLYDAESGEARHIGTCESASCSDIDISPDGSLVSYLTYDADDSGFNQGFVQFYGLGLVETSTGAVHHVDLPGLAGRPTFSPEGDRIALTLQGGQSGVHVVDVASVMDGRFPDSSLVHGIVEAANATWSPNGEWIVAEVTSYRDVGNEVPTLWIVRSDGSDARQLTTPETDPWARDAAWSPDSSTIAYIAVPDDGPELRTMTIDGISATRFSGPTCCEWIGSPAWSPDGEWIAFILSADEHEDSGVMIVRPDGSDARMVSSQLADPVWQPIPKD